jgi:hypothetical protein
MKRFLCWGRQFRFQTGTVTHELAPFRFSGSCTQPFSHSVTGCELPDSNGERGCRDRNGFSGQLGSSSRCPWFCRALKGSEITGAVGVGTGTRVWRFSFLQPSSWRIGAVAAASKTFQYLCSLPATERPLGPPELISVCEFRCRPSTPGSSMPSLSCSRVVHIQ